MNVYHDSGAGRYGKKVQATAEFLEITPEILARAALEAYVKTWEEIVKAERRRIFSGERKR